MGRRVVGLWLGVLCSGGAWAGEGAGQIAFDMVRWDFPSGLHVVTLPDPDLPAVTTAMILDAGSGADPEGKEGLAHLVEHLVFRAQAPSDPAVAGGGTVADVQHALGCDANAFTEVDIVTYVTTCPPEAFRVMLAVEAQRLADPLRGVDTAAFDSEQRVVAIERAERDRTGAVSLFDAVMGAIHPPGHPYDHLPAGTEAAIASMTLDDARAFAGATMRPAGATLVIAGPMTSETMLDTLLPLLPDGALHPKLPASAVKTFQTMDDFGQVVDRAWAEDPDRPGAPLSLGGSDRRTPAVVPVATADTTQRVLRAPVSQATAVAAWILPPTSELPLVTGGMIASLAGGQVREAFGKQADDYGCDAQELVGETVLVCWAAPEEGDAPPAWTNRLAAIMRDAGDLSARWRGLGDPRAVGVRLATELESVAVSADNRAAVVARFVHRGGTGAYLAFQQQLVQGANWQRAWRTLREQALPAQAMRALVQPTGGAVETADAPVEHEARPSGRVPAVTTPVTPIDPARFAWKRLPNGVQVVAVRTSNMPLAEVAVFVPRGEDAAPLWGSTSERVADWVPSDAEAVAYLRRYRWSQGPDWTMRAVRGRATLIGALLDAARVGVLPGEVQGKDVAAERARVARSRAAWGRSPSKPAYDAWRTALPSLGVGPTELDDDAFAAWRKAMPSEVGRAVTSRWHAGGALVVVVGNLTPAVAVAEAAERFASWPAAEAGMVDAPAPVSPGTPSLILVDDPDATTVRIQARCVTPPAPGTHALAEVLTTALGARLMRTLREAEGLAYTPSGAVQRRGNRTQVDLLVTTPVSAAPTAMARVTSVLGDVDAGRWEEADVAAARERAMRAAVLGRADRPGVLASLRRAWSDGVDPDGWASVTPWYAGATVEAAAAMTASCRHEAAMRVTGPAAALRDTVRDRFGDWRLVEVAAP